MKIVIIGPAFPFRGGLASFNERFALQFQNEGHDVSISTFTLQYPNFLFPGKTQFSSDPKPDNLVIIPEINSVNPFSWFKVGKRLKKEKPDIIIVRYWLPFMGPAFGTILRKVRKNNFTKIICLADNAIPHEKRAFDKSFTKYFLKPIHAFITMSEKVKTDLESFNTSKKCEVVVHPLYDNFGEKINKELARKNIHVPQNEKIVLFFGFIRKYKGLDLLLNALVELKASNKLNFKLLIAGEFYEKSEEYISFIEENNLKDDLILRTEFIPDSQVKNYLCSADLVIQPYRNATQSGVTPLAYHFEIPMIVTNVGALQDLVPHEKVGLVCEPNPKSIAATLKEFFTYSNEHFVASIQEEKKKFSWEKLTETVINLKK